MARLDGWTRGLVCTLALGLALGAARQAQAEDDRPTQIEKLFREGLDLYQQGRYSEAQIKLRQLLKLEPRNEMAARLVDEAGTKVMAKMMADPRMGAEPTRLWLLYRKYYIQKLADRERMDRMAARVVDPATSDDERALLYREFEQLGHYAVPSIAPYLGDAQHEDFRTYARVVVARMGPVAVLPLIELTRHPEVLMRENAIMALTDIQPYDERAIPALKERVEAAGETETCKRLAVRGLEKITGVHADGLKLATNYFYEHANRYYLERAGTSEEADSADGFLWHLNENNELVAVQYPLWAWNEQMAEKLALQGAKLHMDQTEFYPLLASIFAAQYMEVKDLVDIVNEQPTRHYLSEEERQTVLEWDKKLIDCHNLVAACGKYYVNEGLYKCLRDMDKFPAHPKLPGVGVFLARILRDLDPDGDLLRAPDLPLPPAPVIPTTPKAPPMLTSIELVPPQAAVPVGGTQQFLAIARDQYGKEMKGIQFFWSTEPGTHGSVDQTGLFNAGPIPGGPYRVYAQAIVDEEVVGQAKATTDVAPEPSKAPGDGWTMPVLPSHQPVPFPGEGEDAYSPGSALVAGMASPDQNVQYACAATLGRINRFPHKWVGSEQVAALLGRGVSENKPLQILVAEEDHNTRNELRKQLEALGFLVTDAVSGRDALLKARTFPPKDILLIGDRLRRDLTPEQLQEEMHADVRTRYVPIGIIHDRASRTLTQSRFGTEIPLVEREMEGNDLKVVIERLEGMRPEQAVTKRRAHEISVDCAQTLAAVNPKATHLNLNDAVPHAIGALTNRKDDVRNPCMEFLGNVKGGQMREEAAAKLLGIYQDENNVDDTNAPEVDGRKVGPELWTRVNAIKALGLVKPEGFADVYFKAQSDRSHEIQVWAAKRFGGYPRRNKELYEFLRFKQVDKDKKAK